MLRSPSSFICLAELTPFFLLGGQTRCQDAAEVTFNWGRLEDTGDTPNYAVPQVTTRGMQRLILRVAWFNGFRSLIFQLKTVKIVLNSK